MEPLGLYQWMTFISQSKTFPLINPERITSVDPGGVQPEMGLTGMACSHPLDPKSTQRQRPYKGRGDPVEPATVVKVKGSGRSWFRDEPTNRGDCSQGGGALLQL